MPYRRRKRAQQEHEKTIEQRRPEEQVEQVQAEVRQGLALLRNPRLDLPANVSPRAALLRAGQQVLGNAALQRMMERPAARGLVESCPLGLSSNELCPFGGTCSLCPVPQVMQARVEGLPEEEEEQLGQLSGLSPTAAVGHAQEEEEEEQPLQEEYGVPLPGRMMGQPVPLGPGPQSWAALARQGLARSCPAPAMAAATGWTVPLTARGAALQYGSCEWQAKNATFPKQEIEWTAAEGDNQFTGKVKATTSAMGSVSMWSLPAGEHQVPGAMVTARFPQCGEGGKKVPFYTLVSAEMANLARMAEEEHRSDYTRTYTLTLKRWEGIINGAAGRDFGPGTKAKVQEQIEAALNAQGNKTRDQWVTEINRLNALSLRRDTPPGAAAHTLKSDGEPVSCPEDCSKVVGTTVRAPSTRLPGDSSETLIN